MKNVNWLVKALLYKHKATPLKDLPAQDFKNGFFYPVAFVGQQHANMCVDASEAMVNHFNHLPTAPMERNPRGAFEPKNVIGDDFIEKGKVHVDNIALYLKKYGPIIVEIPLRGTGHAITCIGCTDTHLIYHDPLDKGNLAISKAEFKRINNNDPTIGVVYKENFHCDLLTIPSLDKDKLASLPGRSNNAYVITKEHVYYIDKQKNTIEDIGLDARFIPTLKNQVQLNSDNACTRDISNDKLEVIRILTGHTPWPMKDQALSTTADLQASYQTIPPNNKYVRALFDGDKITDDPVKNVINFLEDFAKGGKWFQSADKKQARKEVQDFLVEVKKENALTPDKLKVMIDNKFGDHVVDKSLNKRLDAIENYMNRRP